MKLQHLIILLIIGIYFSEAQAMSPRGGGATGGAAHDIGKCDLNASKHRKVKVKDKSGNYHYICTGQAICGNQPVPISCKISEREPCSMGKKCVEFGQGVTTPMEGDIVGMQILSTQIANQISFTPDYSGGAASLVYLPVFPYDIPLPDAPAGSRYKWTKYAQGKIPVFSLITGLKYYGLKTNPADADAQVVCRARYNGALIPGSYWGYGSRGERDPKCHIIANKKDVIAMKEFEVLERGANYAKWVWVRGSGYRQPLPDWAGSGGLNIECRATIGVGTICFPRGTISSTTISIPYNPEITGKFEDGFIAGTDEKGNPLRICRMRVGPAPGLPGTGIPSGFVGDDNICYLPGPAYKEVLMVDNIFQVIMIQDQNE